MGDIREGHWEATQANRSLRSFWIHYSQHVVSAILPLAAIQVVHLHLNTSDPLCMEDVLRYFLRNLQRLVEEWGLNG